MIIMRKITVILLFVIIGISCTNQRQQKLDAINVAESDLMNVATTTPVNNEKAAYLVELYEEFVKEFPQDSASPNMLFKAVEILMNIDHPKEAIAGIDSLIKNYPDYKLLPEAMHLKGFIYDDKLHSAEMARISFKELINKFPDHNLSKNAADYIKILGKTPEEVIREFELMQKRKDSLKE